MLNFLNIRRGQEDWFSKIKFFFKIWTHSTGGVKFTKHTSQVKCILKHFEKSIEIQFDAQRTTTYIQRTALNEEQIYWIKTYFENRENKRVIVRQVNIALEKRFPEIGTISSSTIRRILNRKLWHTYKKLNKRHAASASQSSAQRFLDSFVIFRKIETF